MDLFQEIFLKNTLEDPLATLLDLKTGVNTSFLIEESSGQDPFLYRAKYLGLKVADLILDEKGELNGVRLEELNQLFEKSPFLLGPDSEADLIIYSHIQNCLKKLARESQIWAQVRKFSPPLCHKGAEQIIRDTLAPEIFRKVETVHIRKACFAAWLTPIRQTTGSCFATAPAILIQQRDPLKFFKDLYDLLSTGQMKRVVAGIEYSVPLSLNLKGVSLRKIAPFLERSWIVRVSFLAAGVIWSPFLQEKIRERSTQTIERVFYEILLEEAGLTEEDLKEEELLLRMQMPSFFAKQQGVFYPTQSKRAQKIAEWRRKVDLACKTFETFSECALVRSWEYSIASFCDVKTDFAKWNLYVGLGLHPDKKEGVGSFLYAKVDSHLQKCNREIDELREQYEQEIGAAYAIESMMQGAISEARRHQLKTELMSLSISANSTLERRSHLIERSKELVGFFSFLIQRYSEKLQEEFQELFDPTVLGEEELLSEDSPAGFRLVYKHGRADASQWSSIHTAEGYIEALRLFFSSVEEDIAAASRVAEELTKEITTALIQFIQQPQFIRGAIQRSKEMGRRSPWDYVSGGTLQTLLQTYYNREKPFTESQIIPRSELQILEFFLNVKGEKPILMHSPTHAFVFHPNRLSKKSERLLSENQEEVRSWVWDERMQEHLAHSLSKKLPEDVRSLFLHLYRKSGPAQTKGQFRQNLIDALSFLKKNQIAIVDATLYENTPLFSKEEALDAIRLILRTLEKEVSIDKIEGFFLGPYELYKITKELILKTEKAVFFSVDWDAKIVEAMRHFRFCQPHLILFADTNWSSWYFGFVANPTTAMLELWRLSRNGMQGFPMTDWKEWMDQNNSSPWILLSNPEEYA